MNSKINKLLEAIRRQVVEEEGKDKDDITAYGPGVAADVGGASTADAEAGSGSAMNPTNIGDTVDQYIMTIADTISIQYDKTREEALKFVFDAATTLANDGDIPAPPDDDAADEEVAIWLGKAKSVDLAGQVLGKAREMLGSQG